MLRIVGVLARIQQLHTGSKVRRLIPRVMKHIIGTDNLRTAKQCEKYYEKNRGATVLPVNRESDIHLSQQRT